VPGGAAREFLEESLDAFEIAATALVTGYFEPEYEGSAQREPGFDVPVYAKPDGWEPGQLFATHRDIIDRGLLRGRELAWLQDPLDAFLMQVQGSGRVRLQDGSVMRLGFAGKNGHAYVSIGRLLVDRCEIAEDDISMQATRDWFKRNPEPGRQLLLENPSFVFFREVTELAPGDGPIGTAGVPLTPLRSIAVDPAHVPLGGLVWIEPENGDLPPTLCVAQDTGGAIKGAGRTDLFCGSGRDAGELAGRMNWRARVLQLVPRAGAA